MINYLDKSQKIWVILIKTTAPSQAFTEVRIWPVDFKVERALFIRPLVLASLDASLVGAKIESSPEKEKHCLSGESPRLVNP